MHDAPPPPSSIHLQKHISHSVWNTFVASIIKFPPEGDKSDASYAELSCSSEDMACIAEILMTLAEHGKISLLFKQGHLKQLGAQINHVHPLKFLSTIFKDPELRDCMKKVADDYFKWSGFMEGLAPSLTKEADKGKLEKHLADFSKDIGISPDHIRKYFQNRDWESLIHSLMSFYD